MIGTLSSSTSLEWGSIIYILIKYQRYCRCHRRELHLLLLILSPPSQENLRKPHDPVQRVFSCLVQMLMLFSLPGRYHPLLCLITPFSLWRSLVQFSLQHLLGAPPSWISHVSFVEALSYSVTLPDCAAEGRVHLSFVSVALTQNTAALLHLASAL